jgi:diketogulonate reductase-like aldo/keto reductase
MKRKAFGFSDVFVSEIGFGTWRYRAGSDAIHAAIDHGSTFVDTAEIYGTEPAVAEAIRGCRQRIFLATKAAPRNFRRCDLIAAAENSLKRLGTDYIDLYQLHWPNETVPIAETMAAMEKLVDAGKIRFIGVSNFDLWDLKKAEAALCRHRIASNQVSYSLIDRTVEWGLLDYCRQHQITVIAYSPLGTTFANMKAADPNGVLARVGRSTGKTEAQVALNWVTSSEQVITIASTSTANHAIENCGASGWRLSRAHYDLLCGISCKKLRRGWFRANLGRYRRYGNQLLGMQL